MNSMYAKLFSRIAQSSLMEQDVSVRYCFMMLLAIADPVGDVIGTDVAIARTVNLPLDDFKRCIAALMQPDPDSNSQVHDGRRIIASTNGRGYQLVNYVTYREIKTIEEKRTYMREYMRARRGSLKPKDVTAVKVGKVLLGDVTHAEGEADTEKEGKKEKVTLTLPFPSPEFAETWSKWIKYRKEIKKPIALTTAESQLKNLAAMGEKRAIAMIENTIGKGWQGLREETESSFGPPIAKKPKYTSCL